MAVLIFKDQVFFSTDGSLCLSYQVSQNMKLFFQLRVLHFFSLSFVLEMISFALQLFNLPQKFSQTSSSRRCWTSEIVRLSRLIIALGHMLLLSQCGRARSLSSLLVRWLDIKPSLWHRFCLSCGHCVWWSGISRWALALLPQGTILVVIALGLMNSEHSLVHLCSQVFIFGLVTWHWL